MHGCFQLWWRAPQVAQRGCQQFSLLLLNSALESIILGNYCMALICYARHGLDTRIHRHRSRRSVTGVPRANQLHSPVIQ